MIKAVLFDFDGTVINTNDLIIESYKHAFHKVQGREVDLNEILGLFGRPLVASMRGDYGDDGDALVKAFRDFNESRHDDIVTAFPGVPENIIAIKNAGYKIGVVTSKRREMLMRGINLIGLRGVFDVLIGAEDTKEHKPNPEPICKACEILNVSPRESVYVGDSVFDMLCGKNAGAVTVGVSYTLTDPEKLKAAGMDYFVKDIWDFDKTVLKI